MDEKKVYEAFSVSSDTYTKVPDFSGFTLEELEVAQKFYEKFYEKIKEGVDGKNSVSMED